MRSANRLLLIVVTIFAAAYLIFFLPSGDDLAIPSLQPVNHAVTVAPAPSGDDHGTAMATASLQSSVAPNAPAKGGNVWLNQRKSSSSSSDKKKMRGKNKGDVDDGAAQLGKNIENAAERAGIVDHDEIDIDMAEDGEDFLFSIPFALRHPDYRSDRCSPDTVKKRKKQQKSIGAVNATSAAEETTRPVPLEQFVGRPGDSPDLFGDACDLPVAMPVVYAVKKDLHSFFHLYDSKPEWLNTQTAPLVVIICGDSAPLRPHGEKFASMDELERAAQASASAFDCVNVLPLLSNLKVGVGHIVVFVVSGGNINNSTHRGAGPNKNATADERWVETFLEVERSFPARFSVFTRGRAAVGCAGALALASKVGARWVRPRINRIFWLFPAFRTVGNSLFHWATYTGVHVQSSPLYSRFFDTPDLDSDFWVQAPGTGGDEAANRTKKRCVCAASVIETGFQFGLDEVDQLERNRTANSSASGSPSSLESQCVLAEQELFDRVTSRGAEGLALPVPFVKRWIKPTPTPPDKLIYHPERNFGGGRGLVRAFRPGEEPVKVPPFSQQLKTKDAKEFCSC